MPKTTRTKDTIFFSPDGSENPTLLRGLKRTAGIGLANKDC